MSKPSGLKMPMAKLMFQIFKCADMMLKEQEEASRLV